MSSGHPTRVGGSRESICIPLSERGAAVSRHQQPGGPGAALGTALSHSSAPGLPGLLSHPAEQDQGQEEQME